MRLLLMATLVLVTFTASAQAQQNYPGTYHVKNRDALTCHDADILARLSEPNAKEAVGELNYFRLAQIGDCWQVNPTATLQICGADTKLALVRSDPNVPGVAVRCSYVLTRDLLDASGRPFLARKLSAN